MCGRACVCVPVRVCGSAVGEEEMVFTVSLNPGTERLLRLRVSSLCSEPGPSRSTSERL